MMNRTIGRVLACVCLLSMSFMLVACDERVTAANFDKITTGMSRSQVEKILGSGTDDTSSAGYGVSGAGVLGSTTTPETTLVWRSSGLVLSVIFKDGKVVQKSKREE